MNPGTVYKGGRRPTKPLQGRKIEAGITTPSRFAIQAWCFLHGRQFIQDSAAAVASSAASAAASAAAPAAAPAAASTAPAAAPSAASAAALLPPPPPRPCHRRLRRHSSLSTFLPMRQRRYFRRRRRRRPSMTVVAGAAVPGTLGRVAAGCRGGQRQESQEVTQLHLCLPMPRSHSLSCVRLCVQRFESVLDLAISAPVLGPIRSVIAMTCYSWFATPSIVNM